MDYKTLAIHIASAEDPYEEFAKEAASLDDINKTALAREVNKQFFLSRLEGRNGDGYIDFKVIEPAIKDTHETRPVDSGTVEKVASDNYTHNNIDKKTLISDDMFILHKTSRFKAKSTNNNALVKMAEYNINKELEKEAAEQQKMFTNFFPQIMDSPKCTIKIDNCRLILLEIDIHPI